MAKILRVTTFSGAVYYIEGERVTGGSRDLTDGKLLVGPYIGASMFIDTPERGHLNPSFRYPSLQTSYVVSIEEVEECPE